MYYIEVVPTDIETFASHIKTYQYSVKENVRAISKRAIINSYLETNLNSLTDHDHGSHGMPGIYIKYDMSALKVLVLLGRENVIKMTIRLCSVIAGIIVISGFVNTILQKFWEGFLRTFAPQLYAMNQEKLPLMHDPQKTANIYDVLMKSNKESQNSNKPANINLLTNTLMLNSDPTISLMTK